MNLSKLLITGTVVGIFFFAFSIGCSKKSDPAPPVHDTLYTTKPDTTVNLTKGLLLWLNFSGNIADSSGNNNPTTASGTVLTYDAHGYANSAFGASAGERVYVTNNGSIKFDTAYSLSFGFMVSQIRAQSYISMIDPVTGHGPSFNVGNVLGGASNNLGFGTQDITTDCSAYGVRDNVSVTDSTTFTPLLNAWYNGIFIYHKGTAQVYINGKLISTKTGVGTKSLLCPASKIVIGAWWDGDPIGMNGKLDNIRLYNRVLTPNEITLLSKDYQVTSNSVTPGIQTR